MQQESPDVSAPKIIAGYVRLLKTPLAAPEIAAPALSTTTPECDPKRPCALLLSPHPDDECLTGVLPLRLLREQNWQIINVAVTLGSDPLQRARRKKELAKACAVLGFGCVLPEEDGFSNVTLSARKAHPAAWVEKVRRIVKIIAEIKPRAIVMPHAADWHETHMGTYLLGMDALEIMPRSFACAVALTEYWQPMADPNVMIGVSENDLAALMTALACHAGEVARNAYDRRFPAHLIDNVRRGCEKLSGKGAGAPIMDFAEMYRFGLWRNGKFAPSALNRFVGGGESVGALFD
jgi:LmbE family N-acetylglucosaminyl deacetylase